MRHARQRQLAGQSRALENPSLEGDGKTGRPGGSALPVLFVAVSAQWRSARQQTLTLGSAVSRPVLIYALFHGAVKTISRTSSKVRVLRSSKAAATACIWAQRAFTASLDRHQQ
jgi:hypothetical protein